ncbi:hypothetical protein J8273_2591 [Carpediemonas membranifera]|uniref:Uncharacterized protein n=1 Tax=Carpediemonas membranifera TaxID=201153 RepID=A0A8J6B9U7_9EUKA|nr:hypothetical protein J8273_2591 [Carpediemonas membranifera]|eukprot:KAG9396239.1 hypothetical protein J8273_2591 [Carpediemonas membranifera]
MLQLLGANLTIRTVRTKMTPHGYDSNGGSTPRAALPHTLTNRQQLLGRPSVSSRLTVLGPSDVARLSHTARALLARNRVPHRTKWRGSLRCAARARGQCNTTGPKTPWRTAKHFDIIRWWRTYLVAAPGSRRRT